MNREIKLLITITLLVFISFSISLISSTSWFVFFIFLLVLIPSGIIFFKIRNKISNTGPIIFSIITIFLLLVYFSSCTIFLPSTYTIVVGNREVQSTVRKITSDNNSLEKNMERIWKWESKHIQSNYKEDLSISNLPKKWIRRENPSWIFYYKRGNCQEKAVLFSKMVEYLDSVREGRFVSNYAEDHYWSEVITKNSKIVVDPTRENIIHPQNFENLRNKEMSFIYIIKDDEIINVTNQYTPTGKLVVKVIENKTPVKGAEIIVKSKYLMLNSNDYDEPRRIIHEDEFIPLTDKNGECEFELGGNRYKVIVKFEGKKIKKNVTLKENEVENLPIKF